MVSAQKIKYNGVSSDTGLGSLDIIFDVSFDPDNGAISSYLNRSAVASESYDGRYKNTAQYKYDELFSPKFTIVKKDFSSFTQSEIRKVLKYLTSTDRPALLEVYYNGATNIVDWACIGGWTSIETYKAANSMTVGVVATFEAITPYAMSDIYGRNSNGTPTVYNTATEKNTTMYYWTTATVSGTAAPQYVLTDKDQPTIGTKVYSVQSALTSEVIDVQTTFYGEISEVNSDGSYKINNTIFRLTYNSTKTQKTYSNKITINIDTDDNKPIYPKITINHGYSATSTAVPHTIVPLLPHITFSNFVEMSNYVENTIYYNSVNGKYYWKTPEPQYRSSATKPNYDGWTTVNVTRAYTEDDEYANGTFYYYSSNSTYYWLDTYNFHVADAPPGDVDTTSVKITNQHYDVLNNPSEPIVTIVKNNTGTEKIVLDGANKIVSSNRTRRIFGDDFNLQHLELYDGKNEITIEGNCEVTIEYRTVIKIGEY